MYFTVLFFFPVVLIGNKADLEDQKQVDENEARTLAENLGLKYFETSAFNGQNVSKSVEALLDQVRKCILRRLCRIFGLYEIWVET